MNDEATQCLDFFKFLSSLAAFQDMEDDDVRLYATDLQEAYTSLILLFGPQLTAKELVASTSTSRTSFKGWEVDKLIELCEELLKWIKELNGTDVNTSERTFVGIDFSIVNLELTHKYDLDAFTK